MRTITIVLLAAVLLSAAAPVWAHHAFAAEFDANKQVTLKGTIAKMEWINPHAWLHIDVKENGGAVTRWTIELGPPNSLLKRGWTKQSAPVGTDVSWSVICRRRGQARERAGYYASDGKQLFAGSSGTGAPDENGK